MNRLISRCFYFYILRLEQQIYNSKSRHFKNYFLLIILAYFAPTVMTIRCHRRSITWIFLCNLCFGITGIGWVILVNLNKKQFYRLTTTKKSETIHLTFNENFSR